MAINGFCLKDAKRFLTVAALFTLNSIRILRVFPFAFVSDYDGEFNK